MIRTTLLALLLAAPAYADAPAACPAAVTAGVMKAFPRATVGACKAAHEHGKDLFEVKITKAGGGKVEVDVAPDGTILQIEESITVDALPGAVKKAFAAKYPKARPSAAEKQTADKDVKYEIAFEVDGKKKEATFGADGSFLEVVDPDHGIGAVVVAAHHRAQPREQLVEREWLHEVIVGAQIEPGHPIGDGIARGQHEHVRRVARRAQLAEDREAVEPRQHDVEDDDVVRVVLGVPQALDAIAGRVDRVADVAQPARERLPQRPVVLDDQQAHARSLLISR